MSMEVTVRDTETGESETTIVEDYLLVCAPPCELTHQQGHPNGTHVLTIKGARRTPYSVGVRYEAAEEDLDVHL